MRLIDADALEISDISPAFVEVMGVSAEDIEEADTIEAIPVDWIKRYMKEVGLTDVKYMLETWEKEQIYGKTD